MQSTPPTIDGISDAQDQARIFLQQQLRFSATNELRPHVTLTFAQSSDGKIAGSGKKQLALSGKESMVMTHQLRSLHDGIMVGIGTVLNDNPQLNARLLSPPLAVDRLPRPVVLDSMLRMPITSKLIRNYAEGNGRQPLVFCSASADPSLQTGLEALGVEVVRVREARAEGQRPTLDWHKILERLHRLGIRRLMIEGGASVIDSLMDNQTLVDALLVTVAPTTVGPDGFGFSAPLPSRQIDDEVSDWASVASTNFGRDDVILWQK
ncbi:bacterial bifunctional deaminase-reductase [Testicularia cyperi]|uniref:2,5-diamino-6-ribosylamino-4(3H)-pyrimidinone 5'-phosphate reductase n=1 Tax=Testicularia cyperi TaxID=1882483 RepID=A0A317XI16_9BASI|nr:bacterial bifunctional deaminase-reductase [Testicularia cyperi]